MADFKKIIITRNPEDGEMRVDVDEFYADLLTKDEALAVVAATMFGPPGKPPYVRTHAENEAWNKKYRSGT